MKHVWLTLSGCLFFSFVLKAQERKIREASKNVPLDSILLSHLFVLDELGSFPPAELNKGIY